MPNLRSQATVTSHGPFACWGGRLQHTKYTKRALRKQRGGQEILILLNDRPRYLLEPTAQSAEATQDTSDGKDMNTQDDGNDDNGGDGGCDESEREDEENWEE